MGNIFFNCAKNNIFLIVLKIEYYCSKVSKYIDLRIIYDKDTASRAWFSLNDRNIFKEQNLVVVVCGGGF